MECLWKGLVSVSFAVERERIVNLDWADRVDRCRSMLMVALKKQCVVAGVVVALSRCNYSNISLGGPMSFRLLRGCTETLFMALRRLWWSETTRSVSYTCTVAGTRCSWWRGRGGVAAIEGTWFLGRFNWSSASMRSNSSWFWKPWQWPLRL